MYWQRENAVISVYGTSDYPDSTKPRERIENINITQHETQSFGNIVDIGEIKPISYSHESDTLVRKAMKDMKRLEQKQKSYSDSGIEEAEPKGYWQKWKHEIKSLIGERKK